MPARVDHPSTRGNLQPSFVPRRGVFFSGRFDGGFKEMTIRSVAEEVRSRAPFVPVLIVDAANAEGKRYAELTMKFLAQMELMVPFAFDNYGQNTGNPYSTFAEVTYCLEHQSVQCLPLKLYSTKRWPPVPPDHDGEFRGATQNEFFFKTDILYREFPIHNEEQLEASKTAMADCIIDRYLQMHPELRCQDRRCFKAGDVVLYNCKTHGTWVQTKVLRALGDGDYEIEGKQGKRVSQELLKSTAEAMSPASQKKSRVRTGVYFSGANHVFRFVGEEVRSRAPFVPVVDRKEHDMEHVELMVAFVWKGYGRLSDTHEGRAFKEVAYCLEQQGEVQCQCLPLKLYRTGPWPPAPADDDGGCRGAEQNALFFHKDLGYKEFRVHNDEELEAKKTAMADCIIDRYLELHPELRRQDRRELA